MAFDLDGVLTNGKIIIQSGSEWLREMNIKDGYALQMAVKSGLHIAVITGSSSEPVKDRLKSLGIDLFYQNVSSKAMILFELMDKLKLSKDEVLFMGDDIPDLDAFNQSGVKTCPVDAVNEVKEAADYISYKKGGDGCVRDVIEKTLKLQGKWNFHSNIKSI